MGKQRGGGSSNVEVDADQIVTPSRTQQADSPSRAKASTCPFILPGQPARCSLLIDQSLLPPKAGPSRQSSQSTSTAGSVSTRKRPLPDNRPHRASSSKYPRRVSRSLRGSIPGSSAAAAIVFDSSSSSCGADPNSDSDLESISNIQAISPPSLSPSTRSPPTLNVRDGLFKRLERQQPRSSAPKRKTKTNRILSDSSSSDDDGGLEFIPSRAPSQPRPTAGTRGRELPPRRPPPLPEQTILVEEDISFPLAVPSSPISIATNHDHNIPDDETLLMRSFLHAREWSPKTEASYTENPTIATEPAPLDEMINDEPAGNGSEKDMELLGDSSPVRDLHISPRAVVTPRARTIEAAWTDPLTAKLGDALMPNPQISSSEVSTPCPETGEATWTNPLTAKLDNAGRTNQVIVPLTRTAETEWMNPPIMKVGEMSTPPSEETTTGGACQSTESTSPPIAPTSLPLRLSWPPLSASPLPVQPENGVSVLGKLDDGSPTSPSSGHPPISPVTPTLTHSRKDSRSSSTPLPDDSQLPAFRRDTEVYRETEPLRRSRSPASRKVVEFYRNRILSMRHSRSRDVAETPNKDPRPLVGLHRATLGVSSSLIGMLISEMQKSSVLSRYDRVSDIDRERVVDTRRYNTTKLRLAMA
ncbi:hypothetical protein P7C73_g5589, partial [Tremellales sp. Uapishka_1]